jgi:bacilysin biosynthesis protein BacB
MIAQTTKNSPIFNPTNSLFFPEPQIINVNNQVELLAFQCEDTVIQLAEIAPKATFPLHHHLECQMGMIFNGNLQMNIDDNKTIIEPLDHVYVTGTNINHGSENLLEQTILGFDVKRVIPNHLSGVNDSLILQVQPEQNSRLGLPCQSAQSSWFEIMITQIPPQKTMPKQTAFLRTMGIIVKGGLGVQVDTEYQELTDERIYYVPQQTSYQISNLTEDTVCLIEILLKEV